MISSEYEPKGTRISTSVVMYAFIAVTLCGCAVLPQVGLNMGACSAPPGGRRLSVGRTWGTLAKKKKTLRNGVLNPE